MTLTIADSRGEAVAPVDADPVKALLGADRDGLLTYHGFVSGGLYEVDLAGRRVVLTAVESLGAVHRLRAIAALTAPGMQAHLDEVRDGGVYALRIVTASAQLRVELQPGAVVDWCAGFAAARLGRGQEHAGEDQVGEIERLFTDPDRDDQCRMVILGLMHGRGGEHQVSVQELAGRVGKAKKTVLDALGFGNYLGSDIAEKMIAAFGLRWSVTANKPGARPRLEGDELAEPLPEMPGLVRLRRLVLASREGWLRYGGEPSPDRARWSRRYPVAVGETSYVVGSDSLDAWLDGLAAFNTGLGAGAQQV